MTISDDVLSAYLDGELAPDDKERVRALAAQDADIAARLERLRLAGELLRDGFAPLAAAPVPARLRASAGGGEFRRHAAPLIAALAACAAGIVLGVSIRGDGAERVLALDDGLVAAPALARGLNEAMSGAHVASGDVRVSPIYSFRDGEDRACRVFAAEASGVALEGAACRHGASWRMIALAPAPVREGFTQAGADEPAAVAAAVDRIWADEIGAEEEAALIERGWR